MIARIKKIIHYKKLSSSAFADQIGVPRSTISHILSGRNNPSLEFIQKVLDTFPELRIEWLVRGEGNMVKSANTLFSDQDFDEPLLDEHSFESAETLKGKIKDTLKTKAETHEEISSQRSVILPPVKGADEISKFEGLKKGAELPVNDSQSDSSNNKSGSKSDKLEKKTVKVILFFNDGSFSEHYPQ